MAQKDVKRSWVIVNRAAVLTLWAAVVDEVLEGQGTAQEDAQRGNSEH